jgi:aminopeptidase N
LYESAINSSKGSTVEERIQSAGGVSTSLMEAFRRVLSDASLDGAFASAAITLPDSSELLEQVPDADPVVLHQVRSYVVKELAAQLRPELEAAVQRNDSQPGEQYSPDAKSAARRDIKNKALRYLSALKDPQITQQILTRYREASNMTDQMAALAALNDVEGKERQDALAEFYKQWQEEPLVILKWIGIQAVSNIPGNVAAVKKLLEHPAVHLTNPNTCYSLFLGFARSPVNFHAADGSGYQFLGDAVLKVDQINHQVAARMVSAFSTWRQLDAKRQDLMKQQLKRIADTDGISENVYEIASKSLA